MSPTEIDLRWAGIRLIQTIVDRDDLSASTIREINKLLEAINLSQDLEDAELKAMGFEKVNQCP